MHLVASFISYTTSCISCAKLEKDKHELTNDNDDLMVYMDELGTKINALKVNLKEAQDSMCALETTITSLKDKSIKLGNTLLSSPRAKAHWILC